MIYSTDNRTTWSRFDVLGWDLFLTFVKKTELQAWQITPYLRLRRDFDPPISDFISVPMLFQHNREASTRMVGVIDQFLASYSRDVSPQSLDEIRASIGEAAGTLTDSELIAADIHGLRRLVEELKDLRELLKSGDVWVAWPNQRRSLRISGPLEVSKKGKDGFDEWRQFTSSDRWRIPGNSASVVAALRGPRHPEGVVLNESQKSVMWRATHFAAIEAFADFAIIALHPGKSFPTIPGIGCAIATRGVMELAAHYLKGTRDPFESGEGFAYSEKLKELGLRDEYEDVLRFFKAETYWNQDVHVMDQAIHATCSGTLRKVWNHLNITESTMKTTESARQENLRKFQAAGVEFIKPGLEEQVLSEWRTSIGRRSLDCQVEVTSFGYEWLIALWANDSGHSGPEDRLPITEYAVNTRVFCRDLAPLIERIEEYPHPKHPELQRPLIAIADLLRAFCLASNLGPLVAGAIARELHLHVERLTVEARLCEPYIDKKRGESESDFERRRPTEDDKSLKCVEEELQRLSTSRHGNERGAPDLNALRVRLQDVLQSFAHPGWLIRTETTQFSEPEGGISEVQISNYYRSPFRFADIDRPTMVVKGYPYAEQRESNPFYAAFKKRTPSAVLMAMRDMSTRLFGTQQLLGSAFEIPFVAVEICRIALEHFLKVGPRADSSPSDKPVS